MKKLEPFLDDLPIPPVVKPFGGMFTPRHLAMKAKIKNVKLHQELPPTKVWSYRLDEGTVVRPGSGNSYLGPTVVVNRGNLVEVRWQNRIDPSETLPYEVVKVPYTEGNTPIPQNLPGKNNALTEAQDPLRGKAHDLRATLVTHLHGGRSQADSDGWPDNTAISNQSAYCTYHNDQAAAMLWYHDHANHITRLNVFAGLAGVWLVRDDEEASLDLPDGDFELPLVIQDRNLDLDDVGNFTGALLHKTEVTEGPAEFFGPYTLVNGKIWPKACVEPRLYRFRVLNGSNARTYRLMLLDGQGNNLNNMIWQIGCDQGLAENKIPFPADGLVLMPGERIDLLVDFAAHTSQKIYLWNTAEAPFSNTPLPASYSNDVKNELATFLGNTSLPSGNETDRRWYPQVMRFDVAASASGSSHTVPPDPLWQAPRPPVAFAADMPIRLTTLVEKPPKTATDTAMLVFWEYLEVTATEPAPPGVDVVNFTYVHPSTGLPVTKQYWKAAEEFYDRTNWKIHLGATEQWYIINVSPDTHPVHVHLVDANVNQRYEYTVAGSTSDPTIPFPTGVPDWVVDGNVHTLTDIVTTASKTVDPDQTGPKDTIRINPGELVGVAMKFSPFCGKYMYHCHILEHEDDDMMRPFVIVPKWVPHHEH